MSPWSPEMQAAIDAARKLREASQDNREKRRYAGVEGRAALRAARIKPRGRPRANTVMVPEGFIRCAPPFARYSITKAGEFAVRNAHGAPVKLHRNDYDGKLYVKFYDRFEDGVRKYKKSLAENERAYALAGKRPGY
jgi:hypothetical protein